MNIKIILSSMIAALALAGVPSVSAADGVAYGGSVRPSPLEGAWKVKITPYECATGELFSEFTFASHMTFGARGTVAEISSNPSWQPGQRSPGHGYWERTGVNSYHSVIEAFIQFTSVVTPPTPPRYQRGHQRLEQSIELVDQDHWTSTAAVSFYDLADVIVPPTGCAALAAERIE